jgi:hypothetical protein
MGEKPGLYGKVGHEMKSKSGKKTTIKSYLKNGCQHNKCRNR